jgi:DNA repair exonuclease SbcCD nuclease subunit
MRILHTADIHLRNDRDHRWHAFEAVLERATSIDADVVVVSGDLFDRDVDAQQLKPALRARLASSEQRVLILPGNHDARGIRAGDFYGDAVEVLADLDHCVDIDGTRFVPVPFADGGADQTLERLYAAAERRQADGANVLLFHGELLDLVPGGGVFGDEEPDYMPVRLASFARLGFDYVLAGHFHRAYAVHNYDGGYFVYPGSAVSISTRETGRRHVNVVDVGAAPRSEPLDTHHYEAVTVQLDPFGEVHPADAVDERLRDVHPHAEVLLTLSGCVDLGALGLTETELHAALKKEIARWRVRDMETRWIDVRDVIDHDLFRKFDRHLSRDGSGVSPERRAELRELVLRSLMELGYAR